MERKDKIKQIKAIISGEKSVIDLVAPKEYIWNNPAESEYYELMNPEEGETKTLFTKGEFDAYLDSKNPKSEHVIFQEHAPDSQNEPSIG